MSTETSQSNPVKEDAITPQEQDALSSLSTSDTACMNVDAFKKRFRCHYCQKTFTKPSSLRSHTYTHTGEKPFYCHFSGCQKRFAVLSNLRRHFRVHSRKSILKDKSENDMYHLKSLSVQVNMEEHKQASDKGPSSPLYYLPAAASQNNNLWSNDAGKMMSTKLHQSIMHQQTSIQSPITLLEENKTFPYLAYRLPISNFPSIGPGQNPEWHNSINLPGSEIQCIIFAWTQPILPSNPCNLVPFPFEGQCPNQYVPMLNLFQHAAADSNMSPTPFIPEYCHSESITNSL